MVVIAAGSAVLGATATTVWYGRRKPLHQTHTQQNQQYGHNTSLYFVGNSTPLKDGTKHLVRIAMSKDMPRKA